MTTNGSKPDFASLLSEATLPQHSVGICMRGDLVAKHDAAGRELTRAQQTRGDSLDSGEEIARLVAVIEELEERMSESTYEFVVTALPKPKWRALVAAHQPRRGDDGEVVEDDRSQGVNTETFYPAIIHACVVDPVLTDEQWSELLDEKLTDAQFGELAGAAFVVNAGTVSVPFSRAASLAKRASAGE